MDNMTPADIKALMDDGGEGWGGGAWWIIILFLFVFMGGGGGFFGNRGGCATTEDVQNQFNFAALERQNNETVAAVRQAAYDVTGNAKDLAYAQLGQIRDIGSMIAQNGYQASQCCCETNRNIDSIRYDNAENTQKILDAITGNRMADMQNQINQLQLNAALCGVVRYPMSYSYNAGASPFCGGYNCGCGTGCGC